MTSGARPVFDLPIAVNLNLRSLTWKGRRPDTWRGRTVSQRLPVP